MSATLMILVFFFIGFLVIGLPIAYSIGFASILALVDKGTIPLEIIPQRLAVSIDSFPLLAIPFFVLAGDIMKVGGISHRLINLANKLVGWLKGGLALVTVVASAFFGAISGSAAATTAAIGGLMYPEMIKANYKGSFAAAVGAVSGTLGLLIPPSIALIIYGTQTGTSVGKLFLVSGVAGVITTIVYMLVARFQLKKDNLKSVNTVPTLAETWRAFKDAFWGLLSPVIILGGIYSGIFTATEAAVVAVVYSLIISLFVYKELDLKNTIETFITSALVSGMVLLLISVASLFSWILTVENTGRILGNFVSSFELNKIMFYVIINCIYLILGMFIETIPIIILTTPIFYPIATSLGIDPIHFGVVTVFNLAFGMVTPPFGLNLFVAAGYSKQTVAQMVVEARYFYLAGIALIFVFSFFPRLILWVI